MKNTYLITEIVKDIAAKEGHNFSVAIFEVDLVGHKTLIKLCNHLTHSKACLMAFNEWNTGHVVDLTVK